MTNMFPPTSFLMKPCPSMTHRHMSLDLRRLPALRVIIAMMLVQTTLVAEERVDFRRQILPLLSERCFRCHGPDANSREASLQLDRAETATALLDDGERALVPGDPEASQLWQRVSQEDPDLRMPPAGAGDRLTTDERELLRRWIEQGATYARHWSFESPQAQPRPVSPAAADWSQGPLDDWVFAAMSRQQLSPNPRADRATLLRRLSLDLIGLPPTPREVDDFVDDPRPDAYERVVDRLLAAPSFGERWARVWLDLARYADSAGYAQDDPRVIWRYRDWVIAAFSEGMPFDQFTIEQLAGDLLPNPTDDQLLATAFHRNTMTNSEGGTDDEEFRVAAVVDRVNTTMQVWMGLTMGCAQCHTHKYDPISQREYYQVLAIFNNTADADRGDESPWLVEYSADDRQAMAALDAQIAQLEAEPATASESSAEGKSADDARQQRLKELRERRNSIIGLRTPILRELPTDQRRITHVHVRGNFMSHGEQVEPGVPSAFPPFPSSSKPDRLALAQWLVDAANPLTARVTVNRIWEQVFGVGLVETSEDFGLQGEPPSHPELLDDLALELMRTGWDLKQLLRTIVTSATYRQSSAESAHHRQHDPSNRWLSRGPSYRLPAETVRDQALAIAGLLSGKQYGPSVQPPRPTLGLRAAFGASTDWTTSPGEDRYRRGLYTSWRRTTPYPSLTTFDAPSREVCTIRRIRTNTPLQAFVSLNDPVFVEAAQGLARRMFCECTSTLRERIDWGLRICLARRGSQQELDRLVTLYQQAEEHYRQSPEEARAMAEEPLGPPSFNTDSAPLAALTIVANVLLNLDELLTKQ